MSARATLAVLAALMLSGGLATPVSGAEATAIFASGCFWCTESDFEKLPGVISAESGYTGGRTENPSYEQVSAGATGHAEVPGIEGMGRVETIRKPHEASDLCGSIGRLVSGRS